jgi:hypothetical protein
VDAWRESGDVPDAAGELAVPRVHVPAPQFVTPHTRFESVARMQF